MATAMTFTSLKEDVQAYLERGTVTDPLVFERLPTLINNAERRIARELKVIGFIIPVTTTLAAGVPVLQKPDRWRDTVSMNFGNGTSNNTRNPVYARSYEYCRRFWPDQTQTGAPRFYADYDYNHWLIAPTPDQAYPVEILYYQIPPLLDDANQTNWLTEYASTLLLYATLLEATPFIKADERIPVWQSFYEQGRESLNSEDMQRIADRSATRSEA